MRLLKAKEKQFEEFFGETPPYAILSHTWGTAELTFKDMERNGYTPSQKIDGFCEQALKDGFEHVWVDTCCIDKSSSAELSEAINSMWEWYFGAERCYAYLPDVPPGTDLRKDHGILLESRWFTRGWTLQELIAPKVVDFYDKSWSHIGRKSASGNDLEFTKLLSELTKIDFAALKDRSSIPTFSIAQRMSWAAHRVTTRLEDVAYSLLGLFSINMPLLYGEGTQAFVRLQEEILKVSDDESIFAWDFGRHPDCGVSLFASTPRQFSECGRMVPFTPEGFNPSHYTLTNKGLYIKLEVRYLPIAGGTALARLNCSDRVTTAGKCLAFPIILSRENDTIFSRTQETTPVLVPTHLFLGEGTHRYIHRSLGYQKHLFFPGLKIRSSLVNASPFEIPEFYPPNWHNILSNHGLKLSIQLKNLENLRQDVVFLVNHVQWPKTAVWLDYEFSLFHSILIPQQLKIRAALLEKGKTLAESLLVKKGFRPSLARFLSWKEDLDLGTVNLKFRVTKDTKILGTTWTVHFEPTPKEGAST